MKRLRTTSLAFSRVDLLGSLAVLALLGLLTFSAIGKSRGPGESVACMNNLRQLGAALLIYSAENNGLFPERANPRWPERLHRYYGSVELLRCPSDIPNPASFGHGSDPTSADSAPRSYLFNGFNDLFGGPTNRSAVAEAWITDPAGTVLLGEKESTSGHFYVDFWGGDDNAERQLEQRRHFGNGSNFAFADNSVRFLGFGASLHPTNLWFVVPEFRALGIYL